MSVIAQGEKPQKTTEKLAEKIYIYPHHHCSICGKMIEDPEKQICSKRCQEIYDLRLKKVKRRRTLLIIIIIYSAAWFFGMLFLSSFRF